MHFDRRGSKWVIGREHERTPVLAIMVRCRRRTCDNIMPSGFCVRGETHMWTKEGMYVLKDVRLRGMSDDVWGRIFGDGFVFAG